MRDWILGLLIVAGCIEDVGRLAQPSADRKEMS